MRTLGITPAVKEERTLSVKDFSAYCKRAVNLTPNATVDENFLRHTTLHFLARKPLKAYSTDCGLIVYCTDKKLYSLKNGNATELCNLTFDAPPEVFCIMHDGVKSVCAVENGRGVIVGNTLSFVNFPSGQGFVSKSGVLFSYKGDKIVFGGGYDHSGYTVTVKEAGQIGVENIGKVLALFGDGETLTAVCERGIAKLYTDGLVADYRLEYSKVVLDLNDGDSVKSVSNALFFFKDGGLYTVKNDILKGIKTPLDNADYRQNGKAFTVGAKYLLPIKSGETEYLFVYDTATERSYFTNAVNGVYSDGGYYAVTDGYAVGRLVNGNAERFEWQSVTTDLGSDEQKTLYKITVKSLSPLTVTVKGDYGERVIRTDGGYKSVRLNLKSKEFSVKLDGRINPFGVEYMKLYYRI